MRVINVMKGLSISVGNGYCKWQVVSCYRYLFVLTVLTFSIISPLSAQQKAEKVVKHKPQDALNQLSIFADKRLKISPLPEIKGEIIDLSERIDEGAGGAKKVEQKEQVVAEKGIEVNQSSSTSSVSAAAVSAEEERSKIEFQTGDVSKIKVLPPHEDPSIALNPEAPSPVIGMVGAIRTGDDVTAGQYADQFVRYLQNYFFEVRKITQLIGESLVRQNVIDEDDWAGVGDNINLELARTRQEKGILIKPTHDAAMKRIKPDPQNEAEIFYFFSLNCSWCRYMAPDVERLWRIAQSDKRVKMYVLTVGDATQDLLDEYRDYTGLTMPIFAGDEVARKLGVGFVPALVITGTNSKKAYRKTGQQSFERMFEFLRTVQGLPVESAPDVLQALNQPIGKVEQQQLKSVAALSRSARIVPKQALNKKGLSRVTVEKF